MATKKQTWAIFCATGLDCRHCLLSTDTASNIIDDLKSNIQELYDSCVEVLKDRGANGTPKPFNKSQDWLDLYNKARQAGLEAGNNHQPTPMVVCEHASPINDNSPVVNEWVVNSGVCGFAEIIVRPGTCSFARWLTKNQLGRKSYYGGISIWVSDFGQSMEKKEKYAQAFAEILKENGINAYATSRMD